VLHNKDPIITSDFKKSQQKLIQWGVNPTAENMAKFFFERVKESFPELCKVRVHETDTGYAEYKED
jgi:6-pyruvoyl-tetrahydropterin synthase